MIREGWKTWPMHCMPSMEERLVERMRSAILRDDMADFERVYVECQRRFSPRGAAEWAGLAMAFDAMEQRLWRGEKQSATRTIRSASLKTAR